MKNRFYFLLLLLGMLMYSCENAIEENNVQNVASTGVLVTKTNPIDEVTIDVVKKVAGMYGNAQSAQTRGGEERTIEEVVPVKNEKGDVLMYVVNYAGNAGYVILSGTNEYQPILAYSDTGKFDMAKSQERGTSVWLQEQQYAVENVTALPDSVRRQNARAWAAFFDEQERVNLVQQGVQTRAVDPNLSSQLGNFIEESLQRWSDEGYMVYTYFVDGDSEYFTPYEMEEIKDALDMQADKRFDDIYHTVYLRVKEESSTNAVNPLLKSTWNQTGGYATHVSNGYAGCVAVAVGQIMRYYEYPLLYNWGAMAYNYATDMTALFLAEVGEKVGMKYEEGSSGSNIDKACSALKGYGYTKSNIIKHSSSSVQLCLNQQRPVYMRGVDQNEGGHAWVCDGYKKTERRYYCDVMALDGGVWDHEKKFYYRSVYYKCVDRSDTYYHMNWGWGGSEDGYFYENAVNPSPYNFSTDLKDIVDIYPAR